MNSNTVMIKKLRNAINNKGEKLLYNTTEFFSEEQQRPITVYIIKKAVWDDKRHHNRNVQLFQSSSQIQIVLFLRDYWYRLNGLELPVDNEMWNDIRRKIECLSDEQKVADTNTDHPEKHTTVRAQRKKLPSKAVQSKHLRGGKGNAKEKGRKRD